jgi:hypothetical protein
MTEYGGVVNSGCRTFFKGRAARSERASRAAFGGTDYTEAYVFREETHVDSLQFQKAEYADDRFRCESCKSPITGEYFKIFSGHSAAKVVGNSLVATVDAAAPGGYTFCPACATKVEAQQKAPSPAEMLGGILYGAGAALACCIGYAAVIMITGFEVGIVAILVGYVVGRAVRQGSQGLGGKRCQIAAVVLTYLSITFSYIPVGIQQYNKQTAEKVKGAPAEAESSAPLTARSVFYAILVLGGLAVVSPLLNLNSGVSGMLGVFIIGLGLQRAWAITGRDERVVSGPFQTEGVATVG